MDDPTTPNPPAEQNGPLQPSGLKGGIIGFGAGLPLAMILSGKQGVAIPIFYFIVALFLCSAIIGWTVHQGSGKHPTEEAQRFVTGHIAGFILGGLGLLPVIRPSYGRR